MKEKDNLTSFLIKITKIGCRCNRCGYKWIPREENKIPARCARCNSPYYNKPRRKRKSNDFEFE